MGFLKGNITFTRFAVKGPKPRQFGSEHLERLSEYRFNDAIMCGWTAGDHVADFEFTELKNCYPDHLHWEFTKETNKPPPELFKLYFETELKALAAQNPSGHPSKRNRREAKETAIDRLEDEAKDGRFKRLKSVPILWDSIRNEVYIGSTSDRVLEQVTQHFGETFEQHLFQENRIADRLEPRSAGALSCKINPEATAATLSLFTRNLPENAEVRWSPVENDPAFLGNEFLVWLWHRAEQETPASKVADGTEVEWMFTGGIHLEHPQEIKEKDTINAFSGAAKPQAFRSLQSGYLPRKTALTLVRHKTQWQFKINAETLQLSGLKLPPVDDKMESHRDRQVARLESLRDCVETLDLLYSQFIGIRLSSLWISELADIQKWLRSKQVAAA